MTQNDYIERLSGFFERLGSWSHDHRWIVLGVCLLIVGGGFLLASATRYDNSFEAYFQRGDPSYQAYLEYREDFGSDEVSYIMYEAPDHPHGPWNLEVMRKIGQLTEVLEEEVPFVQEVTSLVNLEFLEGVPDGIEIYDLLEEFPESQEALLEARDKVLAKPLYVGAMATADGRYAAVILEMDRSSIDPLEEIRLDPEGGDGLPNLYPQASHTRIEEILARPEYQGIVFHHTGDVPFNAVLNEISSSEGWSLAVICLAVIAALLFVFFRSFIGVIGPLSVVALSILISVAWMGAVGWTLDLMFGMLPTLLIAVGVATSVHIISEFRAYHASLGDRRAAVRRTMYLIGTPCLLTSLTTAAGFLAMSVAPIKSVAHFAVYGAVGVLAAFLFTVTLLIALLSFGRRTLRREITEREMLRAKGGRHINQLLAAAARLNVRFRRPILVFFGAVIVASGVGMAQLRVDSNFLNDLSEEVPVRDTTRFVDDVMGGTNSFTYLFDTGVEDGVKEPAVLREIERLQQAADEQTHLVKKTYSIVDVLKDISQSFHGGDPAYHVLPDSRQLAAQYLLLYEMSGGEEVEEYVSSDYSRASLELRCKWTDSSLLEKMEQDLGAYLEAEPLESSTVSYTGIGALWLSMMDYITESQIRGFLLAFTAIAVMMCLLFRSVRIGFLSMLPNLTPVMVGLGIMGWLDLPLDYQRLLMAPVAIGISVDFTIHLVTRYRHEFFDRGDYESALQASMADVGRALLITALVLVTGFLVFTTSILDTQVSFGYLLAAMIATALLANFFLMPALVMTFEPFGRASRLEPTNSGC